MKSISLDLSGKIDQNVIALLSSVHQVAESAGIGFFVVGAMARDILLEIGYGISTGRRTVDFDLGVSVHGWDRYSGLKKDLISTGDFLQDKRITHRLYFKERFPVDIVPFGGVEAPAGTIAWPEDPNVRMKVIGFSDAWENAVLVRLSPQLTVRFASLPGLAVLKLIAWSNRGREVPTKDISDFSLILRKYAQAGNEERLFDELQDLLAQEGFDLELAGARLLGREMAVVMSSQTKDVVLGILRDGTIPEKNDQLTLALAGELPGKDYERAGAFLSKLIQGIEEG